MGGKNGKINLEDLPDEMLEEIRGAIGDKKTPSGRAGRGDILLAAAWVIITLGRSKLPPAEWYRVLGTCQRWVRNPGRLHKGKVIKDSKK
jgi:hypothetical protein